MDRRQFLTALAVATMLTPAAGRAQDSPPVLIQAIIDNGGTVQEDGAQAQINDLIAGLANLRGRSLSHARIDLILTSHPTTVWSGTPQALMQDGQKVLDTVQLNDRCSDVGRALRQADQNLRVAGAEEAYVFVYSPLILAPFPCDSGPGIALPQPVPEDIEIRRLIEERNVRAFKVFGVHPSQERVWTDFLEAEGVLAMGHSGAIDFAFLGVRQSAAFLGQHRLIERR